MTNHKQYYRICVEKDYMHNNICPILQLLKRQQYQYSHFLLQSPLQSEYITHEGTNYYNDIRTTK